VREAQGRAQDLHPLFDLGPLLAAPTLPPTASLDPEKFFLTLLARPLHNHPRFLYFLNTLASQDTLDTSSLIQRTFTYVLSNLSWENHQVIFYPKLINVLLTLREREVFRAQVEAQAARVRQLKCSYDSPPEVQKVLCLYREMKVLSFWRVPHVKSLRLPTGLQELNLTSTETPENLSALEKLEILNLMYVYNSQHLILPLWLREVYLTSTQAPKNLPALVRLETIVLWDVPNARHLTLPPGLRELELIDTEAPGNLATLASLQKVILKRVPHARDVLLPPSVRDLQIID
jgi:hypothetical protein